MALVRNVSRHSQALTDGSTLAPQEQRTIDVTGPYEQGLLDEHILVMVDGSASPPAPPSRLVAVKADVAFNTDSPFVFDLDDAAAGDLVAANGTPIRAGTVRDPRLTRGHTQLNFGDSRVAPASVHTARMADRATSRLAVMLGAQQRNFGMGGSSILGEGGDQPLPRMLAHQMGVYGPGYDYTTAPTSRVPPPGLVTLFDAYNTLWKWDFAQNPAFWDTVRACYETFIRLARCDYFLPVGSGVTAPHWGYVGSGWNVSALNANYGVGPVNRVFASGAGQFTLDPAALGANTWPGDRLIVVIRARKDIDNSPIWRCRVRAKNGTAALGTGPYIATYDSTGQTAGLPALGVDGGGAFTSMVVPVPKGQNTVVTFDVDRIDAAGQFTFMGAGIEIGDKTDWPSPLVLQALQPHLIADPDGTHPQITNAAIDQLNDLIVQIAGSAEWTDGRVATVNLPSVIDGQVSTKWFKDDTHHSNLGNAVIAQLFSAKVSEIGLDAAHARADRTCVGPPTWQSHPGDRVWDPIAQRYWVHREKPDYGADGDNTDMWLPEDSPVPVEFAGNRTLGFDDMGRTLRATGGSPQIVTFPAFASVPIAVGTHGRISRAGGGTVTLAKADGTVTINTTSGLLEIAGQFGAVDWECVAEGVFDVDGSLTAPGESGLVTEAQFAAFGNTRWTKKSDTAPGIPRLACPPGFNPAGIVSTVALTTLLARGSRIICPCDGTLDDIWVLVGTTGSNIAVAIWDITGATAGSRPRLYHSGAFAVPNATVQWQKVPSGAPNGRPSLPVLYGQVLLAMVMDDRAGAAPVFGRFTSATNAGALPTPEFDLNGCPYNVYPIFAGAARSSLTDWPSPLVNADLAYATSSQIPLIAHVTPS